MPVYIQPRRGNRVSMDYIRYNDAVNREIYRVTNGRPDLYPPAMLFKLKTEIGGNFHDVMLKAFKDKIPKMFLVVGVVLFIIPSLIAIGFQTYAVIANDKTTPVYAGYAGGGSGLLCALMTLWLAVQTTPCVFSLTWMVYLYAIAGGVIGCIAPLVMNYSVIRNYYSLLTWAAYGVIVSSGIIAILQIVYFIVSCTFLCGKNNYEKFINKKVAPLPLPPGADRQPVDPSFDYNFIMNSIGMAGLYTGFNMANRTNQVNPIAFQQPAYNQNPIQFQQPVYSQY